MEIRSPVAIGSDLPGRLPGELVPGADGVVAVQCGKGSLSFRRVQFQGEERPAAEVLVHPS